MINSINALSKHRIVTAISRMGNLKKRNYKEEPTDMSVVNFKSLLTQIKAMAELEDAVPVGKKLDIVI